MKLIPSRQDLRLAPQIESIRQRLERWRRNRKQRSRIPEELWTAAAELGRRYGLAKTAMALRLDYYSLKERIEAGGDGPGSCQVNVRPAFVELVPQPTTAASECTVELEDPSGVRMRIHLKGTTVPDLTGLSDSFWRMGR